MCQELTFDLKTRRERRTERERRLISRSGRLRVVEVEENPIICFLKHFPDVAVLMYSKGKKNFKELTIITVRTVAHYPCLAAILALPSFGTMTVVIRLSFKARRTVLTGIGVTMIVVVL